MNTLPIFDVYEELTLIAVCNLSCCETVWFECGQLTGSLIFVAFRNKVVYHYPTLMSINTIFNLTLGYHILSLPLRDIDVYLSKRFGEIIITIFVLHRKMSHDERPLLYSLQEVNSTMTINYDNTIRGYRLVFVRVIGKSLYFYTCLISHRYCYDN